MKTLAFLTAIALFFLILFGVKNRLAAASSVSKAIETSDKSNRLPLGDGKISSEPKKGFIYSCQTRFGSGGGGFRNGEWIFND